MKSLIITGDTRDEAQCQIDKTMICVDKMTFVFMLMRKAEILLLPCRLL